MKSTPNIVLAIITGVIVILAIIAAIFAMRDREPNWPDDSPEAAVQAYVQAVVAEDLDAAIEKLDPELECTPEDLRNLYYPQDTAIALLQAHVQPDSATVAVEIGNYGDPFLDPFVNEERFELIPDANEGWLITGNPWPVYDCGAME